MDTIRIAGGPSFQLDRHPVIWASEADREWFKQHPGESIRLRARITGEFFPADGRVPAERLWVRVIQVKPGVRVREPVYVGAA